MKKKLLWPILMATILLAVAFHSRLRIEASENASVTPPENYTLRVMAEQLADMTEEEIDQYFQMTPEDRRVIAEPRGGYSYKLDNSDGVVVTTDRSGHQLVLEYSDPNDSATVAQIKEHLKKIREE